jgi:SOS response regulatory protein OraA/RecX
MRESWPEVRRKALANLSFRQRSRVRRKWRARGFDPDEPRDEHGPWTDGGGEGGAGAAPAGEKGRASDLLSQEPVSVDAVVNAVPGA